MGVSYGIPTAVIAMVVWHTGTFRSTIWWFHNNGYDQSLISHLVPLIEIIESSCDKMWQN